MSYLLYIFNMYMYLVITDSKLTRKAERLASFLKIWTLNLIFSFEKFKFNIFRYC